MADIEVFVQGRGIPSIILVRVPEEGTVRDLLEVVQGGGARLENGIPVIVMLENADEPLPLEVPLAVVGIGHRSRVHVHNCRQIQVTVNFNGSSNERSFPPSVTVGHVHMWAVDKDGFNLPEIDATEHALQVCGTATRPDVDTHIGVLVSAPGCTLCFDLVAKRRVEGAA